MYPYYYCIEIKKDYESYMLHFQLQRFLYVHYFKWYRIFGMACLI